MLLWWCSATRINQRIVDCGNCCGSNKNARVAGVFVLCVLLGASKNLMGRMSEGIGCEKQHVTH
jgi:hypothetical protein